MATLYIVATPIGNLEDISMRALRILSEVDVVLCEDTRVTGVLLSHYQIHTKCISYHEHSDERKTSEILQLLASGKSLALVTDAGTPGISDPGGKLIQKILEEFGDDVKIEAVPGPSAVTTALSISGIQTDKFIFMGFPPHKKGRLTFIKKIVESEWPVVIYESKHRIIKFLEELRELNAQLATQEDFMLEDEDGSVKFKKDKKKKQHVSLKSVVVCRELSKMHETVYRGGIDNIIEKITASQNDQKGEFVVIIAK